MHAIYSHYSVPGSCLLRENYPFDDGYRAGYLASEEQASRPNPYSYLWPFSGTLSAAAAIIELEPSYLDTLSGRVLPGLDEYYDAKREPHAYSSYINSAPASDRFYDDNIWLGTHPLPVYLLSGAFVLVSLLVMYTSSCVFGSSVLLLILQYQGGGEPAPEAVMLLVPVIIIGFVTMVMVRQTMRDPTIIEEYDWDEDSVFKSTGLFRVLVAMFLPVLVIMLFLLVFMYISLSAASSNYRHCPKCGGLLDAENYCYRCNIKYY